MVRTIVPSACLFRRKENSMTRTPEPALGPGRGTLPGTARYFKFLIRTLPRSCLQGIGTVVLISLAGPNLVHCLPVLAKSTEAFQLSPSGPILAPLLGSIKRVQGL